MTEDKKFFTKAELLTGKDTPLDIEVPELGGFITIKPLTAKQWNMVTARKLKGIKQDVTPARAKSGLISVEVAATLENEFAGNAMLISFAMAGEKWTEEEASRLPEDVFKALVAAIESNIGLTAQKKEEIDSFREE